MIPRAPALPTAVASGDDSLFAMFHEAQGAERNAVVVICPPVFQKYWRTYAAVRDSAELLAQRGFPVLRFDYFATGDSPGASGEFSLARCGRDIVAAAVAALRLAGTGAVSLIGFGVGATLAARAAHEIGLRVDQLVLFEPVLDGAEHAIRLRRLHPPNEPAAPDSDQLAGYPFGAALRAEFDTLGLPSARPPVGRIRILTTRPWPADTLAAAPPWVRETAMEASEPTAERSPDVALDLDDELFEMNSFAPGLPARLLAAIELDYA